MHEYGGLIRTRAAFVSIDDDFGLLFVRKYVLGLARVIKLVGACCLSPI